MVKPRFPKKQYNPESLYLQALNLYWQDEFNGTLTLINPRLSSDESTEKTPYYRLWIEILADREETEELRQLQEHLRRITNYKNPQWIDFYALCGLIHYELGEREAAQMLLKKLKKHHNHNSVKELMLALAFSSSARSQIELADELCKTSCDYFQLKRAALTGIKIGDADLTHKATAVINERLGNNPFSAEIGFHQELSKKNFRKAFLYAKNLHDLFPLNSLYHFYFAYSASHIKRYRSAVRELEQLNRRTDEQDPDILMLLGTSMLGLSQEKNDRFAQKSALRWLEKAKARLQVMGLPTQGPEEILVRLQAKEAKSSGRHWFVKLNAKQCFEWHQKSAQQKQSLSKAMGPFVKAGDTCLFISESQAADEDSVGIWRLHAIYKAASDPIWHPLARWSSQLQLQVKLSVSIPLEIENTPSQPLPTDGPLRYGLYEIDDSALEWIEASIRDFALDESSFAEVFAELRLARSV